MGNKAGAWNKEGTGDLGEWNGEIALAQSWRDAFS